MLLKPVLSLRLPNTATAATTCKWGYHYRRLLHLPA